MTEAWSAERYRASQAARKSQRNGAGWELVFERQAKLSGLTCIRFPNGCRTVPGPGGRPRLLRVATPFDWILSHGGRAGFCDTKSTGASAFNYAQITPHQLSALLELERGGHVAGYVVLFQKLNQVAFFTATQLATVMPRQSLRPEHGVLLGSLLALNLKRIFGHE